MKTTPRDLLLPFKGSEWYHIESVFCTWNNDFGHIFKVYPSSNYAQSSYRHSSSSQELVPICSKQTDSQIHRTCSYLIRWNTSQITVECGQPQGSAPMDNSSLNIRLQDRGVLDYCSCYLKENVIKVNASLEIAKSCHFPSGPSHEGMRH